MSDQMDAIDRVMVETANQFIADEQQRTMNTFFPKVPIQRQGDIYQTHVPAPPKLEEPSVQVMLW